MLDYARSHGADYFVLDERETISLRTQLAGLLDAQPPAGLERMSEMDDEGEALVIFRVVAP